MAKRGGKKAGVKRLREADPFREISPSSFSAAMVEETKVLWDPYYNRSLPDDEARELLANACNFFLLLMAADKRSDPDGE